ncbi:MAG: DUF134 domain-containing protein [bacterium]|nr:DUF134 domain-containing protein [bacterium]
MVRPKTCRKIQAEPSAFYYKPQGVSSRKLQEEELNLDEIEAIRLADVEGLYHEQAAQRMDVSRATFGRIVQSARRKIARAIIEGKAIRIGGGNVSYVEMRDFRCGDCGHLWSIEAGNCPPGDCPECGSHNSICLFAEQSGPCCQMAQQSTYQPTPI